MIINHKIKQVINNEGQKRKERQMGRPNAPYVSAHCTVMILGESIK